MEKHEENARELRSFLMARDPSIDRRFRPCPQSQVCLFSEIEENETDSEVELVEEQSNSEITPSSDIDSVEDTSSDDSEGASIYLRFRPVPQKSNVYVINEKGNKLILNLADQSNNNKTYKNIEKHYSFSNIFDHYVAQKEVYEQCIYKRIETEENFSILAYGTSGSGKTYTLLGTQDNPGIVPRALVHIFTLYMYHIYPVPAIKFVNAKVKVLDDAGITKETLLHKRLLAAANDGQYEYERLHEVIKSECSFQPSEENDVTVVIWVSFAELYNEMVYDLLEAPTNVNSTNSSMLPPKRNNLKIMSNNGKIFVKGLTSVFVQNSKEALQLLRYGLQRVNYAATSINENSSRSHCIFFVDILKYYRNGEIFEHSYKFSDLAGSERLDKTGNVGKRMKEAQSINTSLLVLGRCLDVANSNRSKRNADVIPIRDSKLTLLLQAALLGKEKLAMIVTLQPTAEYLEENTHVLGFSSIAKNILYKQPVVSPKRTRYSLLNPFAQTSANNTEQVEDLIRQNIFLRSELDRLQAELNALCEDHVDQMRKQEYDLRQSISAYYEDLMKKQQEQNDEHLRANLARMQRLHDMEIDMLKQKHQDKIDELLEDVDDEDIVENCDADCSSNLEEEQTA